MRLDRFTQAFQVAIADAQTIALGKDHQFIEPSHIMLALLNQNQSSVIPLLKVRVSTYIHFVKSRTNS